MLSLLSEISDIFKAMLWHNEASIEASISSILGWILGVVLVQRSNGGS
jgi:hypothetical protein